MSQTPSGTYTKTIAPGTDGYQNTLIFDGVNDGGPRGRAYVYPTPGGVAGVLDNSAGANLTLDDGAVVRGAEGNSTVAAGIGIDLTASATATIEAYTESSGLAGVVGGIAGSGGAGGGNLYNYGDIFAGTRDNGTGAVGVVASGGTVITNFNLISGGFDEINNDIAGAGLKLTGSAQLSNTGLIQGGNGFSDSNTSGGIGVIASGAGASGTDYGGTIMGGDGYGSGHAGVGLQLSNDATMTVNEYGTIQGGSNSFIDTGSAPTPGTLP
jgi:hypothetical protein